MEGDPRVLELTIAHLKQVAEKKQEDALAREVDRSVLMPSVDNGMFPQQAAGEESK
jgi:hypothetical protein